jgi:hypothetical protein
MLLPVHKQQQQDAVAQAMAPLMPPRTGVRLIGDLRLSTCDIQPKHMCASQP